MNSVRVRCNPCWILEEGKLGSPETPHLARCLDCYSVGGTDAILASRLDELCLLLGRAYIAQERRLRAWLENPDAKDVYLAFLAGAKDLRATLELALLEPQQPEAQNGR
jgi:hypothetical protein